MARIAGVDLPRTKRIEIGLTYIYGIGRKRSNDILTTAGVGPDVRVKDLSEEDVRKISRVLEGLPYERVVAGGGGVNIYGPFLKKYFKGNLVILDDRFAQAEGCRLFLEYYPTLKSA